MQAIYLDFIFAFISVVLGSIFLCSRMSFGKRCIHSPFVDIAILCLGSFSWLVFGFLAVSAWLDYGGLHTIGYRGHWGYTLARSLFFVSWLATLYKIHRSFICHDRCDKHHAP